MRFSLDIGGTNVKCAVVNDDGIIIRSGDFPTEADLATDEFGEIVVAGALSFLSEGDEKIEMVGAGMAGFTDGKRGIVHASPNLPCIKDFELARVLSEGFGVEAYTDNDATVAAWGEYLFGGHDVKDLLVLTLGTGIGGGLVMDGRLYRGANGMAGEFGQMILVPDGPECPGGGRGCLEHWTSRTALEEEYRKLAGLTETVEPRIIHERALKSDRAALVAWDSYGTRLGTVLASAANLLDPGIIVLTGGIAGAMEVFEASMYEAFNLHLINPHKEKLKIVRSNLEGQAGLLGAAFLDLTHE
ncbi:MAG TPA: ROK family protein [Firmicutes bacterium]|nr:ROK family protein [Bacillota bacterium]